MRVPRLKAEQKDEKMGVMGEGWIDGWVNEAG